MKVLHLASGNLYGGIETFLVTLARLSSRGLFPESSFVLSHSGRLAAELAGEGAAVRVLAGPRLRKPWAVLRVRHELRREVRRQNPDIIVAHGPWAYVVFGHGLTRGGPPIVFFQHGAPGGDWFSRLARLRRPAGVLANSHYTASTTPRLFPGAKARVVRLPMLAGEPKRTRTSVRRELGAEREVVLLQASRLEPLKGHRLLLEALISLQAMPWQLWVAGGPGRPDDQRLRHELEGLAAAAGVSSRIMFLGERDDVPDLIAGADIFCQPNVGREGYGLGLLEAMSIGRAVVATELGATSIRISREWGREVPANRDALALALSELIADPFKRQQMGIRARQAFRDECPTEQLAAEMRATLETISRHPSPQERG